MIEKSLIESQIYNLFCANYVEYANIFSRVLHEMHGCSIASVNTPKIYATQ